MAKQELLDFLRTVNSEYEKADAHSAAEKALLKYINGPEITEALNRAKEPWWYE